MPILVAAVPSLLMVLLMSWHFIPVALITRVMDADDLRSAVGWLVLATGPADRIELGRAFRLLGQTSSSGPAIATGPAGDPLN